MWKPSRGEMSRMCQELLALWCLGTTYTSDLEPRDCEEPQRSKQHAEFWNCTCWPGFWLFAKHFCLLGWILNSCWNSQNICSTDKISPSVWKDYQDKNFPIVLFLTHQTSLAAPLWGAYFLNSYWMKYHGYAGQHQKFLHSLCYFCNFSSPQIKAKHQKSAWDASGVRWKLTK